MDPLPFALTIASYLIGSISFARIVGRWRAPQVDLAAVEYPVAGGQGVWVYRGVSATTVSEKVGLRWGLLVVALDVAKGLAPTLWVRLTWPDEAWYLIVGVALVVGHVWPIWHGFVGGRGQSTALGSVLAVNPLILPVAIVVGAILGLLVLTSAHLAREGFGLYLWVWPLISSGMEGIFWFGLALSAVYLMAILPDLREERRLRALADTGAGYRGRLQSAWREFTSSEE